ncbi:MAG: hypothetical protein KU37_09475 [Sulfuricurvum sp. PC08-66]|nr:MAG: hypothetical protein KU37_09475 [Sulfuricurvum sp. PC08-66]
MNHEWSWLKGGLFLGLFLVLAVMLVRPVGVSSQFVVIDGLMMQHLDSNITQSNAYLSEESNHLGRAVEEPFNYSLIFVFAMIAGGVISALTTKQPLDAATRVAPKIWQERFGRQPYKRYVAVFIAGVLALYGARLADGCTSGHVLSGMMQTSLSGYMFAAGVFIAGIPTALLLYKNRGGK